MNHVTYMTERCSKLLWGLVNHAEFKKDDTNKLSDSSSPGACWGIVLFSFLFFHKSQRNQVQEATGSTLIWPFLRRQQNSLKAAFSVEFGVTCVKLFQSLLFDLFIANCWKSVNFANKSDLQWWLNNFDCNCISPQFSLRPWTFFLFVVFPLHFPCFQSTCD